MTDAVTGSATPATAQAVSIGLHLNAVAVLFGFASLPALFGGVSILLGYGEGPARFDPATNRVLASLAIGLGALCLVAMVSLFLRLRWSRLLALALCIPLLFGFPIGTLMAVYAGAILLGQRARAELVEVSA